jgi:hypothetical protein
MVNHLRHMGRQKKEAKACEEGVGCDGQRS